jgi:hypothetical protein
MLSLVLSMHRTRMVELLTIPVAKGLWKLNDERKGVFPVSVSCD